MWIQNVNGCCRVVEVIGMGNLTGLDHVTANFVKWLDLGNRCVVTGAPFPNFFGLGLKVVQTAVTAKADLSFRLALRPACNQRSGVPRTKKLKFGERASFFARSFANLLDNPTPKTLKNCCTLSFLRFRWLS
jgi:hypothetical protein